MMNKKMVDAFNEQINHELYSSYLYLDMAAYCAEQAYDGFAQWLRAQAQEEVVHAMKFYDHIIRREEKVVLKAIEQPEGKYESIEQIFEMALEHEKFISKKINELVDLAKETSDYAANPMLMWFVEEQIEEEENVGGVLDHIKMAAGSTAGLLFLDSKLGQRQAPHQ